MAFQGLLAYAACELHSCKVGTLPEAGFLGQTGMPVNALLLALKTISAGVVTLMECMRGLAKLAWLHRR